MRTLRYIAILFFCLLWFLGCSDEAASYLVQNKWVPNDYRYGDLYRLSNLSNFRVPVAKCENNPVFDKIDSLALHLAGDSFTEGSRIDSTMFLAGTFSRSHVSEVAIHKSVSGKNNILIIQTVERHFRERFEQPWIGLKKEVSTEVEASSFWDQLIALELPYSTERHEAVLFASDFALSIKEGKSWINYNIFGRVSEMVTLSQDQRHLFYYLPSEEGISSNYSQLKEKDITTWVENLNKTRDYYLQYGFDEVVLSIIPNKTSILSGRDEEYNHLIERIQEHPELSMPYIDMYKPLKQGGASLYDKGDTHWNCKGKKIWINKVNDLLQVK